MWENKLQIIDKKPHEEMNIGDHQKIDLRLALTIIRKKNRRDEIRNVQSKEYIRRKWIRRTEYTCKTQIVK